jgi:hypothetical protein
VAFREVVILAARARRGTCYPSSVTYGVALFCDGRFRYLDGQTTLPRFDFPLGNKTGRLEGRPMEQILYWLGSADIGY